MSSAWGYSWGKTWGNVWGRIESSSSGVRRLQMYQLQADALLKYEARRVAEEVVKQEEKKKLTPVVAVKKKVVKKKPVESQTYTEVPAPPFRKKFMYAEPTVYDQILMLSPLTYNSYVADYLQVSVTKVVDLSNERIKRQQRNRRRAAAFLLLAA